LSLTVQFSHCGLADVALAHGICTLITGLILLFLKLARTNLNPEYFRTLRLVHLVFGVLTGGYGLAAYLIVP
jgi:membrane-bound ClpP family serine protease